MDAPVNRASSLKTYGSVAEHLLDPRCPGEFNQAVMELGAAVCRPRNPSCTACPIHSLCLAQERSLSSEYPKRDKRKSRPEHHVAAGVVFRNGRVLITRRHPSGLLGGLWEFPGGGVNPGETAEEACIREIKEETGISVEISSHLATVRHGYTHFRILMEVFCCSYVSGKVQLEGPVDHRWIFLHEIEKYPFPKANHKFIPLLRPDKIRCRPLD